MYSLWVHLDGPHSESELVMTPQYSINADKDGQSERLPASGKQQSTVSPLSLETKKQFSTSETPMPNVMTIENKGSH